LAAENFDVTVMPATATAGEVLAAEPEGIFCSNGPGDPAAVTYAIATLRELIGKRPMFGICLGHQLLGLALGAKTFKLKFGHRGANHPVRDEKTGRIEITSQNHGFCVDPQSLPAGVRITHWNLNDHTLEGFEHSEVPLMAVQYHPEASPGPHDSAYLFPRFREMIEGWRAVK
jgi:carbamoyl-phosphate synthase small subunit